MNRTKEIVEYLSQPDAARRIILAPNAPPVTRRHSGVEVAMNLVTDAADISDTLDHLLDAAGLTDRTAKEQNSGSFSFSQKGLGRVRVSYATQRGSQVVSISVIPVEIPAPEAICTTPEGLETLIEALQCNDGCLIAVNGPDVAGSSSIVYTALQAINEHQHHIIYILERSLTYLMPHGNSIVMQTELGSDTPTFEEGLRGASEFNANIIYVSNIGESDDLPAIRALVAEGNVVIVNSSILGPEELIKRFAYPVSSLLGTQTKCSTLAVRVRPEENMRFSLNIQI